MNRVHIFEYAPILVGATKRYPIELPLLETPKIFKTMTTDMRTWNGEVVDIKKELATCLIREGRDIVEVMGQLVHPLIIGSPCIVMEHLLVTGQLSYMIGKESVLVGNQNFVNFGVPTKKHIRIDIYTGDSKVIV